MMFNADARRAELQAIYDEGDGGNWAPIKAIAESHGIAKPDDGGWEAAINLIVKAETPKNKPGGTLPQKVIPADTPWRKVRTDLNGQIIPNPWQS